MTTLSRLRDLVLSAPPALLPQHMAGLAGAARSGERLRLRWRRLGPVITAAGHPLGNGSDFTPCLCRYLIAV